MKKGNLLWILLLFLLASCSRQNEMPGGSLFNQQVMLYKVDGSAQKQASFSDITAIVASEEEINTWKETGFTAVLAKENQQHILVKMEIDTAAAQKYNRVYGTSFKILPDSLIQFTDTVGIKEGNVASVEEKIKVKVSPALEDNATYIFALSTQSATGGAEIMNASKTLIYSFQKAVGTIKKSLPLTRDLYLAIDGGGSLSNIGATFTMEGLIYVEKFRGPGDMGDAGISTFMGTEGRTLLRFGDAGVDPDNLQANGQDIGVKFKAKQWYHMALVVENGKSTVYVNGKKILDFEKSGNIASFFIGRSYNDNRGIAGRFSEIRLWKSARSATEIQENMYRVDKSAPGLYAYWKMNEVKDNNKIEDVSGNGKDLIMMGQSALSGIQPSITLHDEDGIKVD